MTKRDITRSDAQEREFDKAVALAITEKRVSTSLLQRHLQLSYNAAARLIELMEDRGVVDKPNQLGKRAVLVSKAPPSRAKDFAPADASAIDAAPREGSAGKGMEAVVAAIDAAPAFVPPAPHPAEGQTQKSREPSQDDGEDSGQNNGQNGEGASLVSEAHDGGGGDSASRWRLVKKLITDEVRLARAADQPLNDVGNAARMMIWFGDDLINVRNVGWHSWAGSHWAAEGGDEFVLRCAQMIGPLIAAEANYLSYSEAESELLDLARAAEAKPVKDRDETEAALARNAGAIREALQRRTKTRRDYAKSSGNGGKVKAMVDQLAPHLTLTVDDIDADPLAFNCRNGTLHFKRVPLDDWEPDKPRWRMQLDFKPHHRADRITKVAPVDYDPEAVSPKWQAFVTRFLPNENLRRYTQTYHGVGMTGLMVQALIYHYGGGANGKSVFIQTIADVVGPYLQMLPVEALSGEGQRRSDQANPEFARLPGARVVRVSELEKGFKLREALIKALTGGEPILARHLNKGFFEFLPEFKAVLSSNHKPEIYGTDEGIWRRMNLVHWEVTIPLEERRDFPEVVGEMVAEASGVLNWLVEGAGIYLAEGLKAPAEVQSVTAAHRSDMDPVARFVTHCVRLEEVTLADDEEPPEWARVGARAMREAFNLFMEANGLKPWGETAFGRQMAERAKEFGFQRFDKRVRYFGPVTLHDIPAMGPDGHAVRPERAAADEPPDDGWEPPNP